MSVSRFFLIGLLLALSMPAFAADANLLSLTSTPAPGGGQTYTLSLQTLILISSLTFLPAILLMMTGFTRIIIVLGLLRSAIGTPSSPPNQVLVGLSLFLTAFVMGPVLDAAWANGVAPYLDGSLPLDAAFTAALEPFRGFMLANVRENDLMLFTRLAGVESWSSPQEVRFPVLVAAFMTSELRTAFEIGFLLFVPFVVIDLVVASILMSMGMMMMSPMLVSAPFKILLFVLVDGWALVVGSLAASFKAAGA